jgi:2-polyprenyl-3-methyl-5-hydroxy-6-metoxy-1,4-benzoquinol methylase
MLQNILGARKYRKIVAATHVRPRTGLRVLDAGCGCGDILAFLPETQYVGFDLCKEYIEKAKKRFKEKGTFFCLDVNEASFENHKFDVILATGFLHHLEDEEVSRLFTSAKKMLAKDGRVITVDPYLADGQSPIARFLISKDRGRNVRTVNGYEQIARVSFSNVNIRLYENLLYIPYSHIVLECSL